MAFIAGFVTGSLASIVFTGLLFGLLAVLEFELSKGKDGKPLFVRKSNRRRKPKSSRKSVDEVLSTRRKSSRVGKGEDQEGETHKANGRVVEKEEEKRSFGLELRKEVEPSRMGALLSGGESTEEVEEAALKGKQLTEETGGDLQEDAESDGEESVESAKVEPSGQVQSQGGSTEAEEEEEGESDLLFSSKIPEKQEEAMRFFSVYNQDSYFATAFQNYVRFASLDSMSLIVPLQTTHLASVVDDTADHVSNFVISSDGIYLLTVGVPSNTLFLHRVFHQLSKQPKLIAQIESGFKAPIQLQLIAVRTISENYATVVASAGRELKLWEVNLKSGDADSQITVELESPMEKVYLYGKNDAFRTVHPGAKASGEHLFMACLLANNEVVVKDVTIKKGPKGKSVFEVTDIVSLSHFKGEPIEISDLSIKTETYKTSKYMLCGCTNNTLYLFKRGSDKLVKAKGGSKGSTILREMAKEVLDFKIESTESISAVAIAPKSHMFVVACGRELFFLAYNSRNKTARIMENIGKAHGSRIIDIQVSPEESYVATREMLGNKMKVWSLQKVAEYERFESVNESEVG